MNEEQALSRMVTPSMQRHNKPNSGVIQILVTSSCNLSCFGCTQASNFRRKPWFMSPEQFESACKSLKNYFGVVGVFGGCPTISPHFNEYCEILRRYFPQKKCGLWANHPMGKGAECRKTFNPSVSNLNVHLVKEAYDEFKRDWPESRPFGLEGDSRHSPVFVAMKDVLKKPCPSCNGYGVLHYDTPDEVMCPDCEGESEVYDEERAWDLIADCDINKHWSALIGVFRGELRGWFCEIAASQAILKQHDPHYPDTGIPISEDGSSLDANGHPGLWWRFPMAAFRLQARQHCHNCSVPLRGRGELAQATCGKEQVSLTYLDVAIPKKKDRGVEVVENLEQLGGKVGNVVRYLQNAKGE